MIDGKPLQHWVKALSDKDPELRLKAIARLCAAAEKDRISVASALPSIVKAVGDDDVIVRRVAVETLGWLRENAKEVAPVLVRALRDKDEATRDQAAASLLLIGNIHDAIPAIQSVFDDPLDDGGAKPVMVCDALNVCGPSARAVIPLLGRGLVSKEPGTCRTCGYTLLKVGGKESAAIFDGLLNHSFPHVRKNAATCLGDGGFATAGTAAKLCERLLHDEDKSVRAAAAEALSMIGLTSKTITEALVKATGDKEPLVVVNAAGSLGILQQETVLARSLLAGFLDHREGSIRRAAVFAISKFVGPESKEMIPRLIKLLADRHHEHIPMLAARSLGKIGADAVEPLIKVLEQTEDLESLFWALIAIREIGHSANQALPGILKVLEHEADYRKQSRAAEDFKSQTTLSAMPGAAISALSRVVGANDVAAVPYLTKALAYEHNELQAGAAKGLGKIGKSAKSALPALRLALKDKSPQVREAAQEAINAISKD